MNASKVLVGGFLLVNAVGFVLFTGLFFLLVPGDVSGLFSALASGILGLPTVELLFVLGGVAVGVLTIVGPIAWGIWYVVSGAFD